MISLFFFALAIIFTFGHLAYKKTWKCPESVEVFLSYLLFFNMGLMGLLAAFGHVFMGPEIAKEIGWQPGSPFQYEMGMANLSYGVLGILCYWNRGSFWNAAITGWAILLLGCFVGHVIDYFEFHNTAPYNIGFQIWLFDLVIPLVAAVCLYTLRTCRYSG